MGLFEQAAPLQQGPQGVFYAPDDGAALLAAIRASNAAPSVEQRGALLPWATTDDGGVRFDPSGSGLVPTMLSGAQAIGDAAKNAIPASLPGSAGAAAPHGYDPNAEMTHYGSAPDPLSSAERMILGMGMAPAMMAHGAVSGTLGAARDVASGDLQRDAWTASPFGPPSGVEFAKQDAQADVAGRAAAAAGSFFGPSALEAKPAGSLGAFGGGAMPEVPTPALTAYHGSPHSFDAFDMSKLGSGEGQQAYGHGLYFAENENVAKGYRDQLSGKNADMMLSGVPINRADLWSEAQRSALDHVIDAGGNIDQAISEARGAVLKNMNDPEMGSFWNQRLGMLEGWKDQGFQLGGGPGHMYEVGIGSEPEHFLDWDAHLADQSPHVQEALQRLGIDTRRTAYGMNVHQNLTGKLGGQAEAAQALQDAGIAGIRYLDQGSRGAKAATGTRNYVVFDDKNLSILRKYGMAGLLAAGGVAGLQLAPGGSSPAEAAPAQR